MDMITGMMGGMAPGMFPSPGIAMDMAERARYGKNPFNLTGYSVKVFDMSKQADREAYCTLMSRLMPLCQSAKCVLLKNELQVMRDAWWRYVEWFEYSLVENSLTGIVKEDESEDKGSTGVPEAFAGESQEDPGD